MEFLTSKAGQEVLNEGDSYEYAIGMDAASNDKLEPLDELKPRRSKLRPSTARKSWS